jgi:hypothetical protein
MTWRECLLRARNHRSYSEVQKSDLGTALSMLRKKGDYRAFCGLRVTGAISQGWVEMNLRGPLFQGSFARVAREYPADWTPAEYLFDYFGACLQENIAVSDMDLGRALRNLPSFVRECHLVGALCERNGVRLPNAVENARWHTDLTLYTQGREIAVWSYLDSPHSRSMLVAKIRDRGGISPGLNLLAPVRLGRDTLDRLGWNISDDRYVRALEAAALGDPEPFRDIQKDLDGAAGLDRFRLFTYPD